jgi:hypothetical protein
VYIERGTNGDMNGEQVTAALHHPIIAEFVQEPRDVFINRVGFDPRCVVGVLIRNYSGDTSVTGNMPIKVGPAEAPFHACWFLCFVRQ